MSVVYLSLGSNIGNRQSYIDNALIEIELSCGKITGISKFYNTKPWGVENQDDYLNMCVEIDTSLLPEILLNEIHNIEYRLGRKRIEKWGPRIIDIDIIFYDDIILNLPHLTIPHHLMHQRDFVLVPLSEIAENKIHPVIKKSIAELLYDLNNKDK